MGSRDAKYIYVMHSSSKLQGTMTFKHFFSVKNESLSWYKEKKRPALNTEDNEQLL